MQRGYVQLNDPALAYPIYRTESKEQFERAIRQDPRNSAITDYLPADLDQFSPDLREVLTGDGGLLDGLAKEDIAVLLRSGAGNPAVAQHLSQRFSGTVETMQLETGDTADYRASANGMEVEILREDETVLAALYESWEPLAAAPCAPSTSRNWTDSPTNRHSQKNSSWQRNSRIWGILPHRNQRRE